MPNLEPRVLACSGNCYQSSDFSSFNVHGQFLCRQFQAHHLADNATDICCRSNLLRLRPRYASWSVQCKMLKRHASAQTLDLAMGGQPWSSQYFMTVQHGIILVGYLTFCLAGWMAWTVLQDRHTKQMQYTSASTLWGGTSLKNDANAIMCKEEISSNILRTA